MKRTSSIICIFLFVIIPIILPGCIFDRLQSYEEISNYVFKNKDKLENLIRDNEGFDKSVSFDYKKYLGSGTFVESAFSYSTEIIKFYCGGQGMVTASRDCGFYYSKNDVSYGLEFDECRQTVEEDGSVTYHAYDGTSYLKTKRICANWFYYYREWH
ncbi:MAG: hypothetical protein IJQ80_08890 [Clostridia bacterium]|nr:hypothetical protein [Clostridia bacterium]